MIPAWLHFVPWHWLLWLSLPFALAAVGMYFAAAETTAVLRKVPLSAWLLAAVVVVGGLYHVGAVASAAASAASAAEKAWQAKIDAATATAKTDHDAMQAKIDAQAAASNPVLKAQFDKLQATLDDMRAHPTAYTMPKPAKPLPADCKLDQAVVDAANKALAQ